MATENIKKNKRYTDIKGMRFGRLVTIDVTNARSPKGSVMWQCRCDCGKEVLVSEEQLSCGRSRSCGCLKKENQLMINRRLTFVDNTCVEWLEKRKKRRDNSSGFRGVSRTQSGKWRVSIGLKKKRYYLGTFNEYEDAVAARCNAERILHEGFVYAYRKWNEIAKDDEKWKKENPFYFEVIQTENFFEVKSNFQVT